MGRCRKPSCAGGARRTRVGPRGRAAWVSIPRGGAGSGAAHDSLVVHRRHDRGNQGLQGGEYHNGVGYCSFAGAGSGVGSGDGGCRIRGASEDDGGSTSRSPVSQVESGCRTFSVSSVATYAAASWPQGPAWLASGDNLHRFDRGAPALMCVRAGWDMCCRVHIELPRAHDCQERG